MSQNVPLKCPVRLWALSLQVPQNVPQGPPLASPGIPRLLSHSTPEKPSLSLPNVPQDWVPRVGSGNERPPVNGDYFLCARDGVYVCRGDTNVGEETCSKYKNIYKLKDEQSMNFSGPAIICWFSENEAPHDFYYQLFFTINCAVKMEFCCSNL